MTIADISIVASMTRKGTGFLQIVPFSRGVRVERTHIGRSALPRYWAEWLRWNLLNRTDTRHGIAVEIREPNSVSAYYSSNTTPQGLTETVRAFASEIRPLKNLSEVIEPFTLGTDVALWRIEGDIADIKRCLSKINLPGNAQLKIRRHWWLELRRDRHNQFKLGQLVRMVEHQVAKHLWDI